MTGPLPRPGWRALVLDALLALGLALFSFQAATDDPGPPLPIRFGPGERPPLPPMEIPATTDGSNIGAALLVFVLCAPLVLRRRYPLAVLWATMTTTLLMLVRDGTVVNQELEAQFPLGMFESTDYRPQHFQLRPGDRLFVVSDGISDAPSVTGRYGDAAMHRFARRSAAMAPLQAVRSLLGDLKTFVGDSDLDDDAVAVCLDWTGPT